MVRSIDSISLRGDAHPLLIGNFAIACLLAGNYAAFTQQLAKADPAHPQIAAYREWFGTLSFLKKREGWILKNLPPEIFENPGELD